MHVFRPRRWSDLLGGVYECPDGFLKYFPGMSEEEFNKANAEGRAVRDTVSDAEERA